MSDIDKEEFEAFINHLDIKLTAQELDAVFRHFDTTGDGMVSKEEFMKVVETLDFSQHQGTLVFLPPEMVLFWEGKPELALLTECAELWGLAATPEKILDRDWFREFQQTPTYATDMFSIAIIAMQLLTEYHPCNWPPCRLNEQAVPFFRGFNSNFSSNYAL